MDCVVSRDEFISERKLNLAFAVLEVVPEKILFLHTSTSQVSFI